jgi:hypothetical protein
MELNQFAWTYQFHSYCLCGLMDIGSCMTHLHYLYIFLHSGRAKWHKVQLVLIKIMCSMKIHAAFNCSKIASRETLCQNINILERFSTIASICSYTDIIQQNAKIYMYPWTCGHLYLIQLMLMVWWASWYTAVRFVVCQKNFGLFSSCSVRIRLLTSVVLIIGRLL